MCVHHLPQPYIKEAAAEVLPLGRLHPRGSEGIPPPTASITVFLCPPHGNNGNGVGLKGECGAGSVSGHICVLQGVRTHVCVRGSLVCRMCKCTREVCARTSAGGCCFYTCVYVYVEGV